MNSFLGHVARFIVAAIVLWVVGFLVPGFSTGNFWSALLMALVIAALGWIVEAIFGTRVTPFGRGIIGFLASAVVIWVSQYLVADVTVTWLGAIIAALVVGIIDLFMPTAFDAGRHKERYR
jgi:hypothetical protein